MSDESGEGQANTDTEGGDGQTDSATDGQDGNQATAGDQQGSEGSGQAGADTGGDTGDAGDGDGGGSDSAPESYEFSMPEGVELDSGLVEGATPLLQKYNVSQDDAQAFADLIAQSNQAAAERFSEEASAAFIEQLETWATELKNDKDFGGDNFEANAALAREAIEQFGSDELRDMFDSTGVGTHPAMVKFAHKVGKFLVEDQPGRGSQSSSESDVYSRMYPEQAQQG